MCLLRGGFTPVEQTLLEAKNRFDNETRTVDFVRLTDALKCAGVIAPATAAATAEPRDA